jgi:Tol biopolymer transport system component
MASEPKDIADPALARARWARVRQAFEGALDQLAAERASFVARACADDPELRREVLSLLDAHEKAGRLLETGGEPAAAAPPSLRAGQTVGPYEIVAAIGAGGMGEIYRARDPRLMRDVAIKVLPRAGWTDEERQKRFEAEARAASALSHPNIVAVHDVGVHEGAPFIVSELLEGSTLAELRMPVAPRRALELAAQVARGLAEAHERGVVHRDIKPSNLFLTRGGQVKILDFGVAKQSRAAGGGDAVTEPGLILGTAGYMSPEQARAEEVDFRADQFSLGCVLYQLLTGRAPFKRGSSAQSIAALLAEELPALARVRPGVPRHVAWIVERCLAKEPGARYASTRDLATDLELAVERLAESPAEAPSGARRRVAWVAIGAALAGALVAAAALLAWRWREPAATAGDEVPTLRFLTHSGADSAPAASRDGRTIAFASRRDGRLRIWRRDVASGSEAPLTDGEDDHPRWSPDGTAMLFARRGDDGRVALWRARVVGGDARKLVDDALYGDYAPDGERIAFIRHLADDAGITAVVGLASADGAAIRDLVRLDPRAHPGGAFVMPRWSPDGRTVAVTQSTLQIGEPTVVGLIDVASGAVRALPPPGGATLFRGALAWAGPDRVVVAQPDATTGLQTAATSRVVLWELATGRARPLFSTPINVVAVDVLDGERLVLATRTLRQHLREIPLAPGAAGGERWLTRGNAADRQPFYAPDGDTVLFSSNRNGNLDLWALSRGSGALRRLTDHPAHDWDPALMPDGRLLWSSNRSGAFEVWIADADGSGARQVTRDGVDAENPVPTPDGWILYASANPRTRGIMRVRPDGSEASLLLAGNFIQPEVSPDGRHVAFVADMGTDVAKLRVARVADGGTLRDIPLPPFIAGGDIDQGRCRWLPDGSGLAYIVRDRGGFAVHVLPLAGDAATRRLADLGPDLHAESLGLSPDGTLLAVSFREELNDLMLAESVGLVVR